METTTTAPQTPAPQAPQTNGAQPGDVQAAAQEAIRKLKVKTPEGTEQEVDEAEVLKVYMDRKKHQSVASRELNEGRALRKQNEELIAMLKDEQKLKDVLRKLGHDPRKLSEKILSEHLEEELLDPKDKELRDAKRRLEEYEAREKQKAEDARKAQEQALAKKYMQQYETEFVEALKVSDLPTNKETVAKMAQYIHRAAKIKYKMTPIEAAKLVEEDIRLAHQKVIKDADGEMLLKLLGEDVANKIRKYDTSKLKNPESVLSTPDSQGRRERAEAKRMSGKEWQLHKRGLK